jgi:DNA replication and repair protein RecF
MWDEQLVDTGNRIHNTRVNFIQEMLPVFQYYYEFISGGAEKIELVYESQLSQNSFQELLSGSLSKDRKFLYTTTGIHKDDLSLNLEGFPIKRVGSQGQQKTFLVALKLAQFEFIKKQSGIYPLLLLDDIFDKFDSHRVNKIIDLVSKEDFGQIFITDTSFDRMKDILHAMTTEFKLFQITEGQIITEA